MLSRRLYIYWLVSGCLIGAAYGAAVQRLDLNALWSLVFAALLGVVSLATYVLLTRRGYFR